MTWLRQHVGVLGFAFTVLGACLTGLWHVFLEYSSLAKKSEVESLERSLRTGLLELAECVDNLPNVVKLDLPEPRYDCEIKIHRTIEEGEIPPMRVRQKH